MDNPALTRARICDDEIATGKPFNVRPRNGAGKFTVASLGRGVTTNCASRANSLASRHSLSFDRVVGADEIKQLRLWKSFRVITHGFDGVGNAATPDFLFVNRHNSFCRPAPAGASCSRTGAGAGWFAGLNGDCAAGMKKSRPRPSSSMAACATSKWPRCTGSNEPPNNPSFILFWRALLRQCPIQPNQGIDEAMPSQACFALVRSLEGIASSMP